jgi:hypothetical protein
VHAHDARRRRRTDQGGRRPNEHGGDDLEKGDNLVAGEGVSVDEEAVVEGVEVDDGGGEFGFGWGEVSDRKEFGRDESVLVRKREK